MLQARSLQPLGFDHPQFSRDLVRRSRLARAAVAARIQDRSVLAEAQRAAAAAEAATAAANDSQAVAALTIG